MTRAALVMSLGLFACSASQDATPCDPPMALPVCGQSTDSSAVVLARVGDQPGAQLTVVTHRVDGTVLATSTTDDRGCATVGSEAGALISVLYVTVDTTLVVSAMASTTSQVIVYGPAWAALAPPPPESCARTLRIAPAVPAEAEAFGIDLGCAGESVDELPATVEVPANCLGSTGTVGVIVTGSVQVPDGHGGTSAMTVAHAAGRATFDGDTAVFAPGSWITGPLPMPIPIVLDGVPHPGEVTYIADGIEFSGYSEGLQVEQVRAFTGIDENGDMVRYTSLNAPGLPAQIDLGPDDFLPPIASTAGVVNRELVALQWPVEIPEADAVSLEVFWQWVEGTDFVYMQWLVVLPPDASQIAFPAIAHPRVKLPVASDLSHPLNVARVYLDASTMNGFADVLAGGIRVQTLSSQPPVVPLSTPFVRSNYGRLF